MRNPLTIICGYSHINVPAKNSIQTPVFKTIGQTEFSLADILVMKNVNGTPTPFDGSATSKPTDWCNGAIVINKIKDTGNYDDTYNFFWTKTKQGWFKGTSSTTPIDPKDVTFKNGEAMLVNNVYSGGAVFFRISGEVDLICENIAPAKNSLFGNSTPVDIKLSQIGVAKWIDNKKVPFDGSATSKPTDWCNGAIVINKIKDSGNYDDTYNFFWTKTKQGWFKGTSSTTPISGDTDVTLKAGEAFLLNNVLSSGCSIVLTLPKPIKDAE